MHTSYPLEKAHLLIIGGGPAAYTAAIYAARAALNPVVLEGKKPGGQLMGTSYIENWPGIPSIQGPDLMVQLRSHAESLGARFISEYATSCTLKQSPFTVTTDRRTITADAVIIATGANPRRLNCPGEDTYWGKGVTSCAVCDGALYKNQPVLIVGGGDSAMENASFMTNFTDRITIVHHKGALTASAAMQERVLKDPRITIIYDSTVTEIVGDNNKVTGASITNLLTGEKNLLTTSAVFLAIGLIPATDLFKGQLELTPYGYLVHKEYTQTSVPGVFAAGDVADSRYRQDITSAGSGCMAALDAERYLKK